MLVDFYYFRLCSRMFTVTGKGTRGFSEVLVGEEASGATHKQ